MPVSYTHLHAERRLRSGKGVDPTGSSFPDMSLAAYATTKKPVFEGGAAAYPGPDLACNRRYPGCRIPDTVR